MKCDVLVVGAGPAGSMAAKTIAQKNVNVVLIERNKKIGYPVRCAEGINKFLFKDTGIKKDGSFIEQKIDGTKIYFYDEMYELDGEQWQGYTINRKVFDQYLARNAENAGAALITSTKAVGMRREGKKWIVKTKSLEGIGSIESKIVIGADGFECNVGKWAGIRKKWSTDEYCKCYELNLDCPNLVEANKFHLAFGEEFPMGYAWIFPKKNTVNVGVGVFPKTSAKNALDFFLNKYPGVKTILGKHYSVMERRGGCIPTSGPRNLNETVSDGIILIGDAAGIVDPITGEGISSSMISGVSAGETVAPCIIDNNWDGEYLSEYQQRWMRKRYINTTLGKNMNSLLRLKKTMCNAFTNKKISKRVREQYISMIMNL